jgi:antitoxin PrlF
MITSKAQMTIPRAVRVALDLKSGDELVCEIQAGRVIISKRKNKLADDPFFTFTEWNGKTDRKAFADL